MKYDKLSHYANSFRSKSIKLASLLLASISREEWSEFTEEEKNKIILIWVLVGSSILPLVLFVFLFIYSMPRGSSVPDLEQISERPLPAENSTPKESISPANLRKTELAESLQLYKEESEIQARVKELNASVEQELVEGIDREEKKLAEARKIAAAEEMKKQAAAKASENQVRNNSQKQIVCEGLVNEFDAAQYKGASSEVLERIEERKIKAGCN